MKKIASLPVILLLIIFYGCASKKQTIHFEPIGENEFNSVADSSFAIPHGKIWEERKKMHDSCMEVLMQPTQFSCEQKIHSLWAVL